MSDHPVPVPARELTPAEHQERIDHCFAIEQKIKAGLRAGREAMWEVARGLHQFDEESGWSALGYESLADWLADPEVGMRKSLYYSLVASYREIVVLGRADFDTVRQLDPSKVDVVLPAVKSGGAKEIEDALDDAAQLGQRDLREKYRGKPELPPGSFSGRPENDQAQVSRRRENDPPEPVPSEEDDGEAESWLPPPLNPTDDGERLVAIPVKDLLELREAARKVQRSKTTGQRRAKMHDLFAWRMERALTDLLEGGGR